MEHNPSLTPAYLAGKVDEYVKFAARDTIKRNARRDRNARWARVPDGEACDFCKMLGSRGFVYHSEAKAETRESDGDKYHPFCNCQIAVCFDPFIEEYYKGWTKVTRGYGDGELAVPGRDGSNELRDVDIDELFAEYQAMLKDFNKGRKGSRYRDYTRGAMLADEQFDAAMKRLADARTREELHEAADDIVANWPANSNGRNKRQWDELSRLAEAREKELSSMRADPLRVYTPTVSMSLKEAHELPGFIGPQQWQPRMTVLEKPADAPKQADYSLLTNKEKERLSANELDSHELFAEYGLEPVVLPADRAAGANIDLIMTVDGKTSYWELKDPEKGDRGQRNLTTEGVSKWKRMREGKPQSAIDMGQLGTPKIAIDNRFNETQSDHDALRRLVNDMAFYERKSFDEAILVMKNGKVIHLRRMESTQPQS